MSNEIVTRLIVKGYFALVFVFLASVFEFVNWTFLMHSFDVNAHWDAGTPSCKSYRIKALNYKDLPDDSTQDVSRSSITDTLRARSKRNKLKRSKRKSRNKFLTVSDSKRPTTEEDLARHVQSVFSDDILHMMDEEMLVDSTFDLREGSGDTTKILERHPSLVLNADYQVCFEWFSREEIFIGVRRSP